MKKIKEHQLLSTENLQNFLNKHPNIKYIDSLKTSFRFFTSEECSSDSPISYRRRDFFKISLLKGEYLIYYLDQSIRISGNILSFFSPKVPYTIETIKEEKNTGYFIFKEEFYDSYFRNSIHNHPVFSSNTKPIFLLSDEEMKKASVYFEAINNSHLDTYELKNEILLGKINELLHYGNQLSPFQSTIVNLSRPSRIYTIFSEYLERQFPILNHQNNNEWRKPSRYALEMNIHVNYLNRNLKEITGKSTRELIDERWIKEAILMLKHTDQNISEIAYNLGFNEVSNFNHLFKKYTGKTPKSFRFI